MKNLKLLYKKHIEDLSSLLEDCVCTTIDFDTGHVFVAVKKGEIIQFDPSTKSVCKFYYFYLEILIILIHNI